MNLNVIQPQQTSSIRKEPTALHFGISHGFSRPVRKEDDLNASMNFNTTFLFRTLKSSIDLAGLLFKHFPNGAPILSLGCSTGEADVLTPALIFNDLCPSLKKDPGIYPITGVDIDNELIELARLKLLRHDERQEIKRVLGTNADSLQFHSFDPARLTRQQQQLLVQILRANLSYQKKNQLINISLDALNDERVLQQANLSMVAEPVASRMSFEQGNILDIVKDKKRIQTQGAIFATSVFYALPLFRQIQLAYHLVNNMQEQALLVTDRVDNKENHTDLLLRGIGFKPTEANPLIYKRPANPKINPLSLHKFALLEIPVLLKKKISSRKFKKPNQHIPAFQ